MHFKNSVFKYVLFIPLISTNLFSQTMKKVRITGTAENSKVGAIVATEDKEVYYLDGLSGWNDEILGKKITVSGNLVLEYHSEDLLMNDKGEYSQGFSGEIKKISNPVWKLVVLPQENDTILEKLKKSLPKNWILKTENQKLVISCTEKVSVLYENKINAPINTETLQQKEERFKKYGQLINPQFVFIMKKKLSRKEIDGLKSGNNKIFAAILELQKKLKDIPVTWKDGNYRPRNKEEEKLVSEYEKEKRTLESEIIKLPDYQSEKYALYLESELGLETEFISVLSEKSTTEMFRIKNEIFVKVLETIK
jgi:hypothetical protein